MLCIPGLGGTHIHVTDVIGEHFTHGGLVRVELRPASTQINKKERKERKKQNLSQIRSRRGANRSVAGGVTLSWRCQSLWFRPARHRWSPKRWNSANKQINKPAEHDTNKKDMVIIGIICARCCLTLASPC